MKRTFKTACTPDRLKALRVFVRNTLIELAVPQTESDMMVLAVDEVCANRMIHANDCNKNQTLEVMIYKTKNSIVFEISDTGAPFNYTEYQEPETEEIIKSGGKGGLGLKIVRKIMDEIDYYTKGARSVCRLVKYI